jgi:hypothetical protein
LPPSLYVSPCGNPSVHSYDVTYKCRRNPLSVL